MSQFKTIKKIINELNNKISVINISNTFTRDSCEKYICGNMNNDKVALYIEKNKHTSFYFMMCPQSDIIVLYKDNFTNAPLNFNENTVKLGISRILSNDNNNCNICYNQTTMSTICQQCALGYCSKCILKLSNNSKTNIKNNKIYIGCPICNTNNIILDYPMIGICN